MDIFIIGEIIDYENQENTYHFSLTKGYFCAVGFSKIVKTHYLTSGKSNISDGVNMINIDEIDEKFYINIGIVLLIRENNIIEIIKKVPYLEQNIFDKKFKLGIKSDSLNWIKTTNTQFKETYDMTSSEFVKKYFTSVYVQTLEFKNDSKKFFKYHDMIKISRMGIPNINPYTVIPDNPYKDYSYCVDSYPQLVYGKALWPIPLTEKGRAYSKLKNFDFLKEDKIRLIYMGRLKNDSGKIILMLRDIMKKLGERYELHVFPGRFELPDCPVKVFSPKFGCNLDLLRNSMFYNCTNVYIHYPINNEDKAKFLYHSHIGIDFSSVRPHDYRTPAGGAKLMEYCYFGLKVICETNINNADLCVKGKNGICLDGLASVDNFVENIKNLENVDYDRDFTINQTISTNNWDLIASEIYQDFVI
jgi:hypothetical protein